jgi:hypothetical protein
MWDALEYARERRYALLLLNGIPNFYDRFGYVDIFDKSEHAIRRATILEQEPGLYQTRPATLEDAPILVDIYWRHYGSHPGSLDRTIALQEHQLRHRPPQEPFQVVLAPDGKVCGYLWIPGSADRSHAKEVAADDRAAALALLRYHALIFEPSLDPPEEVWWPLPFDSITFYVLADHVLPDVSNAGETPRGCSLRSQTCCRPNAGWMARPAHLRVFLQSLLPAWQERWRASASPWTGVLTFEVDHEDFQLNLGPATVKLVARPNPSNHVVRLSQQCITQLAFGYRPITWATVQPGQQVPPEVIPVLDILFPRAEPWVTESSDEF